MTQNFYFFRHGQTNENRDGIRYSTGADAYLLDIGITQAEKLSAYLSDKDLNIIYSSPFLRATDTAKIVAKNHPNIQIITDNKLTERTFGFWYNDDIEKQKRVDKTLETVRDFLSHIQNKHQNIAISSHGGITRALCYAAGMEIGSIKNCECFHFTLTDDKWAFVEKFTTGIVAENQSDKE